MIKLIFIELKKILTKKSIYVMMIIMLLFNLLNNILFYTDYDKEGFYKYQETDNLINQKELLKEELTKYDYNKETDILAYINLKTKLDIIELKENYKVNTWQYNKINDYLYNIVEEINIYKYKIEDDKLLQESCLKLEELLIKFKNDDWQYFINLEIKNLEKEQMNLKEQLEMVGLEEKKHELKQLIDNNKFELKILKYRIQNNIREDNNYLNLALNNYIENIKKIKYYQEDSLSYNDLTKDEKKEYQQIKSELEQNKYILKNKINYNKQNNLNYQLRTIVEDYEIFIIIIILIISSTIIAEEINSGTIKLLLIKPYSRGKILLSKYLTSIIVLLFTIIYLILIQLIIGGIIFGVSSLELPVIAYDFTKEIVVEYNVFVYMLIRIISKLPMLLMILTISFSLSTVINNVAIATMFPLFIYIFTPSISYLIIQYKVNFLKYFINVNWQFHNYLFGQINEIEGVDLKFSLIVWNMYFVLILMFTYLNFKRKNIRNV